MDFKYVIGEKDDAIIILFYGKIGSRELVELEKCKLEIQDRPNKIFIFNFRDVEQILPAVHQFLVKFQMQLRENGKVLGLCSFKPDVKFSLLSSGIIREPECFNNIPDAWKALTHKLATHK